MRMAGLQDWISKLKEAFPPGSPPEDVASSIGRELKPEGAEEIDAELKGRPWTAVTHDAALRQAPSLSALSIPAFVYYIPAFMKAAAIDPVDEGAAYVMYALTPLAHFESYSASTCSLFTPDQAGAIAGFLELLLEDESFVYMAEELPPAIALWTRRAQEAA
jgi:hypothetical protein